MSAEDIVAIAAVISALAAVIAAVASLRGNRVARDVKGDTQVTRHVANATLKGVAASTDTTPAELLDATKVNP